MANAELLQRAQELGVNLHPERAKRIVITGYAELTPHGDADQTWQAQLEGRSVARLFPEGKDPNVKVAGPLDFRPEDHFDRREMRGLSAIKGEVQYTSRKAARMAKIIGEDGQLNPDQNRHDWACWIGTGGGATQHQIDVYLDHHAVPRRRTSAFKVLEILMEEVNAGVSMDMGIGGWGGSSSEACATGLGNPVEAARAIREGLIKGAVTGGFDDALEGYPEVGIALFAAPRVLTTNEDPQKASRPFDKDRDGFLMSAGGGVVIMEEEQHAKARGATILAEVFGYAKSMDGEDPTGMNTDNVARTMLTAMWDEEKDEFHQIDAIFAHATSTKEGDIAEAEAIRKAFGSDVPMIPITATKSVLGHELAGAGATNLVTAIRSIREGIIPHIASLENPDPRVSDLMLVRERPQERVINKALVVAYGFGGHNATMVIGAYKE